MIKKRPFDIIRVSKNTITNQYIDFDKSNRNIENKNNLEVLNNIIRAKHYVQQQLQVIWVIGLI